MHTEKPTLSVICVFRNRKEWVEPTLKALYSIQRIPCEFIFIDDASTDGTTEAVRSLIEYFQHEQTYFFEQEAPHGRGNSLNSALEQVRGRFLWIPENLHTIDQDWLSESIETLISSRAYVAIAMEDPVPRSAMDWLHLLQNERVPYDRNFLFDFGKMRSIRKFTDPHWSTRHATEWAIRLMSDADPVPAKPFARGETRRMEMDDRSKKECVLALLRIPELSLSGQEKAFRMLRSFGHTDTEEDEGSAEPLYQEAQSLYKSGNGVAALETLNRILAAEPDHRRARLFKIQILEKMRRYVEAAELKHGYDLSGDEPESKSDQEAAEGAKTAERAGEQPEQQEQPGQAEQPEQAEQPDSDRPKEPEEEESDFYIDLGDDIPDAEKPDAPPMAERESAGPKEEKEGREKKSQEAVSEEQEQEKEQEKEEASEISEESEADEEEAAEEDLIDLAAKADEADDTAKTIATSRIFGEEINHQPQLTVIIPTATVQRPVLEDCLTAAFRQTSPERTRFIIVDNASVDDTGDYLKSLMSNRPMLTVLRNEQNLGFAGAVNQGLAKAGEGIVVVMHNDVMLKNPVPARLAHKLDKNPDIGLIAPCTEQNTWNRAQRTDRSPEHADTNTPDSPFTETDTVDGFLMAFRNRPGLTMNRDYGLAYFDDADFCYRLQKKGFRIVIDNKEQVVHLGGKTTGDLGLSLFSKQYWKNASLFHKEWGIEPRFPSDQTRTDPLRQFVLLGQLINPFYPEQHLLDYFEHLFTSEQKTRILKTEFPPEALKAMIRLLMATNQRDVLRSLEQQLDPLPPDTQLYYELVTFYFDRTIYSRCKRYLARLENTRLPVELELYHLKIAIGEKDYARAAELLKVMMDRIPTHPEVLIAAASIHRKNGNREQSAKFTALAQTFDPSIRP